MNCFCQKNLKFSSIFIRYRGNLLKLSQIHAIRRKWYYIEVVLIGIVRNRDYPLYGKHMLILSHSLCEAKILNQFWVSSLYRALLIIHTAAWNSRNYFTTIQLPMDYEFTPYFLTLCI